MSDTPLPTETAVKPAASSPLIIVDSVSKRFDLQTGHRSTELRERFGNLLRRDNQSRLHRPAKPNDVFWALQDVSFTVEPGQPVGVVGHNGSGKSTMLKLLTGIMLPTKGSIKVKGRVGALIEVGAGFHPDLTGRENVYLSGSILGLSRRDVDARFDRIVQFANLERFIDTPVKRYSSGMYMRLGFAVAAHTDPDVLLIDEVLAVGDTLFQRKCLAHLKEFVQQGGAVVFVSHAMAQVAELCKTCVWLDHGQVRYVGETDKAIEQYMAVVSEREAEEWKRSHPGEWELLEAERLEAEEATRQKEESDLIAALQAQEEAERKAAQAAREEAARTEAEQARFEAEQKQKASQAERARLADYNRPRILGLVFAGSDGQPRTRFMVGESLEIRIRYQFLTPPSHPVLNAEFWRDDGLFCFGTSNFDHEIDFAGLPLRGEVKLTVQYLALNAGTYRVRLRQFCDYTRPDWIAHPDDIIENALEFTVEAGMFGHGATYLPTTWEFPRPLPFGSSDTISSAAKVSAAIGAKESVPAAAK